MHATTADIRDLVQAALREDAPWGDVTVDAVVPADAQARGVLNARESGVLAGQQVVNAVWAELEGVDVTWQVAEGEAFAAGETLAILTGDAAAILTGERVALNFVQHLSAIATQTSHYVEAVRGTAARIVDTRKTTPLLRSVERDAVRTGGGSNHRNSLSDAVMIKDNHLSLLMQEGRNVTEAITLVRHRISHTTHLEVEVDRLDQLPAVLAAAPDTIMLDNFSVEELRKGVALINGKAWVEASGGVNLETVRAIAQTGVDIISIGGLTHGVPALDLGLDFAWDGVVLTSAEAAGIESAVDEPADKEPAGKESVRP